MIKLERLPFLIEKKYFFYKYFHSCVSEHFLNHFLTLSFIILYIYLSLVYLSYRRNHYSEKFSQENFKTFELGREL